MTSLLVIVSLLLILMAGTQSIVLLVAVASSNVDLARTGYRLVGLSSALISLFIVAVAFNANALLPMMPLTDQVKLPLIGMTCALSFGVLSYGLAALYSSVSHDARYELYGSAPLLACCAGIPVYGAFHYLEGSRFLAVALGTGIGFLCVAGAKSLLTNHERRAGR